MASAKDNMMSTANYYIKQVTIAKSALLEAIQKMIPSETEVSVNWRCDSGMTMEQSLEDLRMNLIKLQIRLGDLETSMKNNVEAIFNNWVEDDTIE